MVGRCSRCQSTDPAPSVHEAGKIGVKNDWRRLGINVITVGRSCTYPWMPADLVEWRRRLRVESAEETTGVLNELF